jgi:hypothetical protein
LSFLNQAGQREEDDEAYWADLETARNRFEHVRTNRSYESVEQWMMP